MTNARLCFIMPQKNEWIGCQVYNATLDAEPERV
jgi:hypothetical protein